MKIKMNFRYQILSVLIFSFFIQSCSNVRLISDYDEITDNTTNELQEKVSAFFIKMEREIGTDSAKYEYYISFYDNAKVDIEILTVRANAAEKNEIVQKQIKALGMMIRDLEKLHKIGFVSPAQIEPLRQPFNSAFTAIIKLQMALKRGDAK